MNMIEKVARAFWFHMTFGGNSAPFEQQPKQIVDHYKQAARLAIQAMREPTEEMLACIDTTDDPGTAAIYTEMIDAALKE